MNFPQTEGRFILSDERDKVDIRDTQLGLDFISSLRPVDYRWDLRRSYIEITDDGIILNPKDGSKKKNQYNHGIIAQDLKEYLEEKNLKFGGLSAKEIIEDEEYYSIDYLEFIAPLIKSIQELNNKVDLLTKEIELLKSDTV